MMTSPSPETHREPHSEPGSNFGPAVFSGDEDSILHGPIDEAELSEAESDGDGDVVTEASMATAIEALRGVSVPDAAILDSTEVSHVIVPAAQDGGHEDEIEMLRSISLPDAELDASPELMKNISDIPDKMAFKIGEAAEMVGVKQYVLRYWETEFEVLRPRKSKNNQRVYSRRDVETAMMIRKLLYDDRFSIEGARAALKHLKGQVKEEKSVTVMARTQDSAVNKLRSLVGDMRRMREMFA